MALDHIIFLDLDGVLITTYPMWKEDELDADGYSRFDPVALKNFQTLLEWAPQLRIIISSSRRVGKTLEQIEAIFAFRGIKKKVVELLPVSFTESKTRGEEIYDFLCDNPIERFLIIDDDYTILKMNRQMSAFSVLTEYQIGFDKNKLAEAQMIVNSWSR